MSLAIATPERMREVALQLYNDAPASMTISAVTDRLGGGSRSTIGPLLKQLRAELNMPEQPMTAIPAELRTRSDLLIHALMTEAGAQARREFETRSARLDGQLTALEADLAEASTEADELSAAKEELSLALDAANTRINELVRRLDEAEAALITEKVEHEETRRLLLRAETTNTALVEDQARNASIDEKIVQLTSLIAEMGDRTPKRGAPKRSGPASRPGRSGMQDAEPFA